MLLPSSSSPSSDFALGVSYTVGALLAYKIYQLFRSPSIDEIEKLASKPLKNVVAPSQPSSSNNITIFGFEKGDTHPSFHLGITDDSNYVIRVEAYLRLIKQPYVKAETMGLTENPRGKVPFCNLNGQMIDDSSVILAALQNEFVEDDPDRILTADQLNTGHLIRQMLFGSLYWVLLHQKFETHAGRNCFRRDMAAKIPPVMRDLVCAMVFRNMRASMYGCGVGRMPHSEIVKKGQADVRCLSKLLGTDAFFFGCKLPTSYDTDVYAWLVLLFYDKAQVANDWVGDIKEECRNLVEHTERMRALLFPELVEK